MKRRIVRYGLALLMALGLAGALLVRRSAGTPPVRTIAAGAVAMAVDGPTGSVVVAVMEQAGCSLQEYDLRTGAMLRAIPIGASGCFAGRAILALDERRGRAVLATSDHSGQSGRLYVADLRAGRLVVTRTFRYPPMALALDTSAGRALVVSGSVAMPWRPGNVVVLDTSSGATLRTIPVDELVGGIAVDERAGVASVGSQHTGRLGNPIGPGRLTLISTASGQVLHSLAVPQRPYQVAIAAHSGRAFVLCQSYRYPNDASAVTVDEHSARILRTVPIGHPPSVISMDEAGGHVLIMTTGTWPGKGTISLLDVRSGALLRTITLQDTPVAMATDARRGMAFVATVHRDSRGVYTALSQVVMLDMHSWRIVRSVPVGQNPVGVAAAEPGAKVLVISAGATVTGGAEGASPQGAGSLSAVDARTAGVLRVFPLGVAPSEIALGGGGRFALVLNQGGTIRVFDASDRLPRWLRYLLPFLASGTARLRTEPSSITVLDMASV